jgi:two-component system, sporulation sensor kinase D|tara:strand:+ start:3104 stop:4273 length:1170 start_codon:yes stop_codon:yes gene_type:complete
VINNKYNNRVIRIFLLLGLITGVSFILINTIKIIDFTKEEERKKIELWAIAQKNFIENKNLEDDLGELAFMVLTKNFENPIIQVDNDGRILSHKNIFEYADKPIDSSQLKSVLNKISKENEPIEIRFSNTISQKLYYGNSSTFNRLKHYPLALLIIGLLFFLIIVNYFKSTIDSFNNKIWTAFAKETAHQIATPLSSLLGWLTILKENKVKNNITIEIEKDLEKLKKITNRFSEIGNKVILKKENINEVLKLNINYLKKRNSSLIKFKFLPIKYNVNCLINKTLFDWVIENLVKNSIDSMRGKGIIQITILKSKGKIDVCIKDNGKGINDILKKKIFNSGFTTKDKGWGLGLSLAKRIITEHHNGEIYLKKSELNVGTEIVISIPVLQK